MDGYRSFRSDKCAHSETYEAMFGLDVDWRRYLSKTFSLLTCCSLRPVIDVTALTDGLEHGDFITLHEQTGMNTPPRPPSPIRAVPMPTAGGLTVVGRGVVCQICSDRRLLCLCIISLNSQLLVRVVLLADGRCSSSLMQTTCVLLTPSLLKPVSARGRTAPYVDVIDHLTRAGFVYWPVSETD